MLIFTIWLPSILFLGLFLYYYSFVLHKHSLSLFIQQFVWYLIVQLFIDIQQVSNKHSVFLLDSRNNCLYFFVFDFWKEGSRGEKRFWCAKMGQKKIWIPTVSKSNNDFEQGFIFPFYMIKIISWLILYHNMIHDTINCPILQNNKNFFLFGIFSFISVYIH